jgi:hypothetical protein
MEGFAMDAVGTGLRELVEHALGAGSAEARLRAVAQLRAAIVDLEREQARRALQEGCSFGTLARALGITRQSAHRRYRDLVEQPAPPVRRQPRGRVLITAEARAAVELAREEARALGASAVGSEHLLLGIVRGADGSTAEALTLLGVTLDAARACTQPTLAADGDGAAQRGISAYARTVLEQSLREALARGDGYIGTDHLLLAALRDPRGGAARTLAALGVPASAVRAQLDVS